MCRCTSGDHAVRAGHGVAHVNPGEAGCLFKLRELSSAAEPLNPEVIEQVRIALDLTIRDGFGQTETTAQIGNPLGQEIKFGLMGRPLPGHRVLLLDFDEHAAQEGEI